MDISTFEDETTTISRNVALLSFSDAATNTSITEVELFFFYQSVVKKCKWVCRAATDSRVTEDEFNIHKQNSCC
jgi:hypothetical protein